jgi:threonine dehydrogenase-like Zn-dependent dehydrogenase
VSARLGAMAEPLANGVHAVGLGLSRGEPVEHATVLGAGTIGVVTLQAALLAGIEHVAVLEPQPQRRALAHELGANSVYATPEETERDADLVIDAVGAQATRALGLELLRPGGQLVCIGLATDDTTLGFHAVVRGQLAIQGSYAYTMDDYEHALDHLASGRASLGELPEVMPLDAGPEAFARLAGGPPPDQIKVFLAGAGRES